MSRGPKIALGIAAAAALLFVGGPWLYINVLREPAAVSFVDQVTTTSLLEMSSTLDDATGVWKVSTDSQVGYRVDEVLFGQNATAVGRTAEVTGTVTIENLVVTAAEFTVDMTTIKSDKPKRDAQFESRIMDVINYPTALFLLGTPITIKSDALTGSVTHTATGSLTLRGVTKQIEVAVVSSVSDGQIVIAGEIVIVFAEWDIPNPSIPGISTEDSGVLEFQLVMNR